MREDTYTRLMGVHPKPTRTLTSLKTMPRRPKSRDAGALLADWIELQQEMVPKGCHKYILLTLLVYLGRRTCVALRDSGHCCGRCGYSDCRGGRRVVCGDEDREEGSDEEEDGFRVHICLKSTRFW